MVSWKDLGFNVPSIRKSSGSEKKSSGSTKSDRDDPTENLRRKQGSPTSGGSNRTRNRNRDRDRDRDEDNERSSSRRVTWADLGLKAPSSPETSASERKSSGSKTSDSDRDDPDPPSDPTENLRRKQGSPTSGGSRVGSDERTDSKSESTSRSRSSSGGSNVSKTVEQVKEAAQKAADSVGRVGASLGTLGAGRDRDDTPRDDSAPENLPQVEPERELERSGDSAPDPKPDRASDPSPDDAVSTVDSVDTSAEDGFFDRARNAVEEAGRELNKAAEDLSEAAEDAKVALDEPGPDTAETQVDSVADLPKDEQFEANKDLIGQVSRQLSAQERVRRRVYGPDGEFDLGDIENLPADTQFEVNKQLVGQVSRQQSAAQRRRTALFGADGEFDLGDIGNLPEDTQFEVNRDLIGQVSRQQSAAQRREQRRSVERAGDYRVSLSGVASVVNEAGSQFKIAGEQIAGLRVEDRKLKEGTGTPSTDPIVDPDSTVEGVVDGLAAGFRNEVVDPVADETAMAVDQLARLRVDDGRVVEPDARAPSEVGTAGETASEIVRTAGEILNVPALTREADEVLVEPALYLGEAAVDQDASTTVGGRVDTLVDVAESGAKEAFDAYFTVNESRLNMIRRGRLGDVSDGPLFDVREGRDEEVAGLLVGGLLSAGLSAGTISTASRVSPRAGRATAFAIQPGEELLAAGARRTGSTALARVASVVADEEVRLEGPAGPESVTRPFQLDRDVSLGRDPLRSEFGSRGARRRGRSESPFRFDWDDRGALSLTGPTPNPRPRPRPRPDRGPDRRPRDSRDPEDLYRDIDSRRAYEMDVEPRVRPLSTETGNDLPRVDQARDAFDAARPLTRGEVGASRRDGGLLDEASRSSFEVDDRLIATPEPELTLDVVGDVLGDSDLQLELDLTRDVVETVTEPTQELRPEVDVDVRTETQTETEFELGFETEQELAREVELTTEGRYEPLNYGFPRDDDDRRRQPVEQVLNARLDEFVNPVGVLRVDGERRDVLGAGSVDDLLGGRL